MKRSNRLCCCVDLETVVLVFSMASTMFSCFNIGMSAKMLLQDAPEQMQIIFVSIQTTDIPEKITHVYRTLAYIKIVINLFSFFTSTLLFLTVMKNLTSRRCIGRIWVLSALIVTTYMLVEGCFTLTKITDVPSKCVLSTVLAITVVLQGCSSYIVLTYSSSSNNLCDEETKIMENGA